MIVRHALLAVAGIAVLATSVVARQDAGQAAQVPTVKDGVYTKAQADTGKATFDELCAKCHRFAPWEKSDLNPDLGGAEFLDRWNNRPVFDLMSVIYTSMPNDGSAFLEEEQAADLTAYILQQNGFPVGQQPLKADDAARQIKIVK